MVSIIMSAYNASSTIEEALQTCLSQTYSNLEIIVVNDCSIDNTEDIVNKLREKDNRIKLINHEVNKGAGLARRTGILNMSGEYMTFLDSDDYLKEDCIETLVNAIQKYSVDVVCPGSIVTDFEGNIIKEKIPKLCIQTGKDKFSKNDEDTKRFMNPMLIKASLWKNVLYSDRRFIEDTQTLFKILWHTDKILLLDYAGYYYRQNPNSLIHTSNDIKYAIYQTLCAKDITEFLLSKNNNSGTKPFLIKYANILNMSFEEEEVLKYKDELDELYEFYLLIKKQTCLENA